MDELQEVLKVGDYVMKTGGDYTFEGYVLCRFKKLSGKVRYVVENADGVVHIFNGGQLSRIENHERASGLVEVRHGRSGSG